MKNPIGDRFFGWFIRDQPASPLITYVHISAMENQAFPCDEEAVGAFAKGWMDNLEERYCNLLNDGDFKIAMIWGEGSRPRRRTDMFSYDIGEDWSQNPEIHPFMFSGGKLLDVYNGPVTCGDGIILLGQEETHRRTTPELGVYLAVRPTILGANGKPLREL